MISTALYVLERFVGNVQQAPEVITLDRVFVSRGYFHVVGWWIHQARSTLERLFVGTCKVRMRVVEANSRLVSLFLLVTHTAKLTGDDEGGNTPHPVRGVSRALMKNPAPRETLYSHRRNYGQPAPPMLL
jgi:hypothetical protein